MFLRENHSVLALTWIAGSVLDSGFTLIVISVVDADPVMSRFCRVRNSLDSALDP
jgi:hypothetical protein